MTRKRLWSRVLTVAFAVAQIALPAGLSVSDARGAADARGTAAHVEETSGKQCKPPHTAECGICRYLSVSAAKGAAPTVSVIRVVEAHHTPAGAAIPLSVSRRGFQSRAPPTLPL
jgi:hypothetical protein